MVAEDNTVSLRSIPVWNCEYLKAILNCKGKSYSHCGRKQDCD